MEKKNLYSSHLFLVGVVAIVAVVALVLHSNGMTGAPSWEVHVDDSQTPCLDTDPTNNYYVAGMVHLRNVEYHDYCLADGTLGQYECGSTGSVRFVGNLECKHGCENGACLTG